MSISSTIRDLSILGLYPANLDHEIVYNVKKYASGVNIGDGNSHPLSASFASLPAAQSVYPKATALTESLAWHAHQLAIDTAAAALGGIVYSPGGTYMMSPCPSALKFPLDKDTYQATGVTATNCMVNWKGDGDLLTHIKWTVDMGSTPNSAYAIMCGQEAGDPINQQNDSRYWADNGATSAGWFRDLSFVGPALTLLPANTINTTGCNMSGICWAAHRQLNNVRITWFYAGVDFVGDHTTIDHLQIERCYYGWYFNHNSSYLYGDLSVDGKSSIGNCRKACVGFAYGGAMGTWQVSGRMFMGQSPYVFFKEATPASPTYTPYPAFLSGVQFDALFTEGVGNAVIWDDNLRVNGTANSVLDRCSFKHLTLPGWSDAKKIAGLDRCHIQVGAMNGCKFENVTKMDATGCTRPLIDISNTMYGESLMSGDIEATLTSATAAGLGIYNATLNAGGTGYAVNDIITLAGGTLATNASATTIKVLTVSAGAVVTFSVLSNGLYSAAPSGTITQASTTGSGTGASFITPITSAPLFFRASDVNCKRMAVEHTHGDGSCGPYKGHVYAVYNGNGVTAGHACCELFYGVLPARESAAGPYLGQARSTCTFTGGNVIVAEEGDDLPFFNTGPSNLQILKKLTEVSGSLTDAQGTSDGRVVGYANASQLAVHKSARSNPHINKRPRVMELLGAVSYTVLAADWGKIKRLNSTVFFYSGATISSGGTSHAVNDVITLAGGTLAAGGTATTVKVMAVSSGVVTKVAIINPGAYTITPTNPIAQGSTTGSGTGLALFGVVDARGPMTVLLPNTLIAGFEVELWQGYLGPINWTVATGSSISAAGGITQTDGQNSSVIATVVNYGVGTFTIANGGTGHTVNDIITLASTPISTAGTLAYNGLAAQIKVTSVSGGVITSAVLQYCGNYKLAPTGSAVPQAATTGAGTGATFAITSAGNEWFIRPSAPRRKLINTQTAPYNINLIDDDNSVFMNVAGATDVYLPANLPQGFKTSVIQGGAGQITFVLVSGGTLVSYTSLVKTAGQGVKIDIEIMSNAGSAPVALLSGQLA